MDTVQSIEAAVRALPAADLLQFRAWFAEFDGAAWDQQLERDASSGRLDALAQEALKDYQSGSCVFW